MDVAMMGKLGFDIRVNKLPAKERTFLKNGLADYKQIRDVVLHGDLYRLLSPYEGNRAALVYVSKD